jgi:hypothetical protein
MGDQTSNEKSGKECNVCMDNIVDEKICTCSISICSECVKKVDKCPQCRREFCTEETNTITPNAQHNARDIRNAIHGPIPTVSPWNSVYYVPRSEPSIHISYVSSVGITWKRRE